MAAASTSTSAAEEAAAVRIQSRTRGRATRSGKAPKGADAHMARLQKAKERDEALLAKSGVGKPKRSPKKAKAAAGAMGSEAEVAAVRKVQAHARGLLKRNGITEAQESLEVHLDALQLVMETEAAMDKLANAPAAAPASAPAPAPAPAEEYSEFSDLENLIGRQEEREYLRELERKKLFLSRQIQEMERGKYYLPAKQQRKVFKDIRNLNEQLASTNNELRLMKSGSASSASSSSAAAAASSAAPAPASRPGSGLKRKGSTKDAASALPFLSVMAKYEHLLNRKPMVRVNLTPKVALSDVVEGEDPPSTAYPIATARASMEVTEDPEVVAFKKALEERDKAQALQRTREAQLARLSPMGHESAVRKALLQGELMKINPAGAVQQIRALRKSLESLELQIRMSKRSATRIRAELDKPPSAADKTPAKKRAEMRNQLMERLGLLERYASILEAAHAVMTSEVKVTRKTVLKRAARAKKENDRLVAERKEAARLIQRYHRGARARKVRRALEETIAENKRRIERLEKSRKIHSSWSILRSVLATADGAKRRAIAATMLQRAARERQWRNQILADAQGALDRTEALMKMQRDQMSAIRFGPQRNRLLAREEEYQKLRQGAKLSVRRSRRSGGKIVETEAERDMRIEIVASHAHRAARAAQMPPPPPPLDLTAAAGLVDVDAAATATTWQGGDATLPSSSKPTTPRLSLSRQSLPTPSLTARPPSSARPASSRAPRAASARHGIASSDLSAVTQAAFRRAPWVQTADARAFLETSTAAALQPSIDRMAGEGAAGNGAHAALALALAKRACSQPPSRVPEGEKVVRSEIFFNPRLDTPKSMTARIASLWVDSSLSAAHVKEEAAKYGKWHKERTAWIRSSGLRRRVLQHEEQRCTKLATKWDQEIDMLHERMRRWQREDDAALRIQSAFRSQKLRMKKRRQMQIGMRMKGVNVNVDDADAAAGSGQKAVAFARKLKKMHTDTKAMAPAPAPAAEEGTSEEEEEDPPPTRLAAAPASAPAPAPAPASVAPTKSIGHVLKYSQGLGSVLDALQDITQGLDVVMAPIHQYDSAPIHVATRAMPPPTYARAAPLS